MTPDDWQRVKKVASAALDWSDATRDAFIAAECGDDVALRQEVLSLVGAIDAAADRYEAPALALPGAADAIRASTTEADVDARGLRIGPYQIEREIGHGGMGRVYLAHRVDGEFEQHVAVKFVGDGALAGAAMVERFRQERRILAMLDHANIARLVDGGATADGRPFVVMEYVSGEPIDTYAQSRQLDLRARVALVRAAAGAVQYAHQRLIIHRDIKPSNILVTSDGIVKLLDFGIATLFDPGLAPEARPRTVMRALTFETASPEQLQGQPITIAADVYGLGLLLYRLLTGSSPYRPEAETDAALVRAVCEDPPMALAEAARHAETPAPFAKIPRDLALVALKALRKEPERRYRTAAEFSDDLGRFLEGRPVEAAPDTRRYRTARFVRRHWIATAASSAAVLALSGATGLAIYQARVASEARADAERRFADVRQLANAFLFEFHDAIADLPGSLAARQLVVRRAAEYLDALAADNTGDRGLERELGSAHLKLAGILGGGGVSNLGDLSGAEANYQKARQLFEALAAQPEPAPADIDELAHVHIQLSRFFIIKGNLEQAERHAAEAVAILDADASTLAANGRDGRLATANHQLGFVQVTRRDTAPAVASLSRAMDHAARAVAARPDDPASVSRLARIAPDYASAMLEAGAAGDALETIRAARKQLETLIARDPENARYRADLALLQSTESDALDALDQPDEALRMQTLSMTGLEQLIAAQPTDQGIRVGAMLGHCSLGRRLLKYRQREAGIARLRQCIEDGLTITRASPTNYFARAQLGHARLGLGEVLLADRRSAAEGCRQLRFGLEDLAALAATAPELSFERGAVKYDRLLTTCGAGH